MRILLIAPEPFFEIRGASIALRNMLTALAEADHEVDLLCYPWGRQVDIPGVRTHRVPRLLAGRRRKAVDAWSLLLLFQLLLRVFWLCARTRYDVIHTVDHAALVGNWVKRLHGTRFVCEIDSLMADRVGEGVSLWRRFTARWIEAMEIRALKHADVVLLSAESLVDDIGALAEKAKRVLIRPAPLGVAIREDREKARQLGEELDLEGRPVVVYTGNFDKHRGVDLLLRAAPGVIKHCPDVRFVLVGGDPDQIARMLKLVRSLELQNYCVFAGERPMDEMAAFMTLATVLVSPRPRGHSLSTKILTYMQSGRPIVATRIEAHTEVLDETCAILVMPQAADIATGILRAIQEPLIAAALSREAGQRAATQYSLASFKHKVRTAYQQLGS